MDEHILPIIAESEYADFQRFVADDLPDTYEEWLQSCGREISYREERGTTIKEIAVQFDRFRDWCLTHNEQPTLAAVRRFTIQQNQPPEVVWDYDPLDRA
jgi:hypothetical protein